MSERTRRKGLVKLTFSLEQFREWFEREQVGGRQVYNEWVMSSWKKEKRPSVDRVDPRCHYTFDNMQVITAQENRIKGDKEKELLWGNRIKQMTLDGKLIAIYPSMKAAIKITGVNQGLLSMACNGQRKQTGGYKWEVLGNVMENPELLKS